MRKYRSLLGSHHLATVLALSAGCAPSGREPFNPDDCVTCEHRHEPQGGHCYMFKEMPRTKCGQYRKEEALCFGDAFAQREGEVEVK